MFDQTGYDVRCEWGLAGLRALGPVSDVVVIVDVLSFSTAVDVVVANGASVLPYSFKNHSAEDFAASLGALCASRRGQGEYSLSPVSLRSIPANATIVLPSPNGSTLSLESPAGATFAACLRNCEAVAERVNEYGSTIAVIPAGEQWADGSLRPCIEDWIGAGAVLAALRGRRSPEAELAVTAFECSRHDLTAVLARCGSGLELIDAGFASDVEMAAGYMSSRAVPILRVDRFVNERW
jgi:2-phosphosulfolactate phosphatase